MRFAKVALVLAGISLIAVAGDKAGDKMTKGGEMSHKTCGQQLSEDSRYPQQLSETLAAVAKTYGDHAAWMEKGTDAASRKEAEVFRQMQKEHEALSKRAAILSSSMKAQANLPMGKHDMKAMPASVMKSMEAATEEMRQFASMIQDGVKKNELAMKEMKAAGAATGGSGDEGMEAEEPMRGNEPYLPETNPVLPPGR